VRFPERVGEWEYAVQCDRLTEGQLEALRLWAAGLSYQRIGAALGLTSGGARARIVRARERLAVIALEDAA